MSKIIPQKLFWLGLERSLAFLNTFVLVVGIFYINRASPQRTTFLDTHMGARVRPVWDMDQAAVGWKYLLVALTLSIFGLIIHALLAPEKDKTRAHVGLAAVGVISLLGLIIYEVSF